MKSNSKMLAVAATAALLLVPQTSSAQGGAAARVAVEVAEQLAKRGSTQAAKELAEFGGETAVRELLQQAEKEGGERLLQVISRQTSEHGVVALQAMKGAPKIVAEAVEQLPKEFAENGMRALARDPAALQTIIREVGQEGLEAAAKYPGVGAQIAKTLGKEGATAVKEVGEEAAIGLARHADDIAKLGAPERASLLAAFRQAPQKVLKFLEKHPKTMLTAAAVTAFVANKEELLGSAGSPGFIERMFKQPVYTIGYVIAGLLGLWGGLKLLFTYRGLRRRMAK